MMKKRDTMFRYSYPFWLLLPALVIYTVFTITPLGLSIVNSFTDWNINRLNTTEFNGLKNYIEIFNDPIFARSMFNTLLFAFGTATLKLIVGLALALALQRNTRLNSTLRTIFYAPCVLSMTVMGVLFTSILAKHGLLNNFLESIGLAALAKDWLGSYGTAMFCVIFMEGFIWAGFNMFILISGLQAIPNDFYEAADLAGANKFYQFWHITLPLLVPSLTVTVTLNFCGGLKVFDIIYVMTNGGPGFDTQVMGTYTYRAFSMGLLGESCAGSVILCVVVVALAMTFNYLLRRREVEM